ncbi:hypothetical protein HDU83_004094 [Entophlyctis luteolus]|nr:hypothetical protein HDU83_004094 [Entophlyctis luteolus]
MEIDRPVLKAPISWTPSDQFIIENNLNLNKTEDQTAYSLDADNNIKVLLSVSGSGKTRQLLELLFNQFGYYFVVGFQLEDFGSADLAECFRLLVITLENVKYYLKLLYFVHGFLHPEAFFGHDIFLELFDFLVQRPERVTGRSTKHIANYFDFAAIDKIQAALGSGAAFRLPQNENNRPFFSPLMYYSKRMRLKSFIVSGTGINFQLLKDFFLSGTMKYGAVTNDTIISCLEPLDKSKVVTYIRKVLTGRNFSDDQVKEVVDMISENLLFHGRGQFVAFVLDCILWGHPVDLTVSEFIRALSRPDSAPFPLRFYAKDIELGRASFKNFAGEETLDAIVRQGLIWYLMTGEAVLDVKDQIASDMVQYSLGFCSVDSFGFIQSV